MSFNFLHLRIHFITDFLIWDRLETSCCLKMLDLFLPYHLSMLPNVRLDVPGKDRHVVICPFWKQQCFAYKLNDKGININLCRYCCMDEHDKHEILDIEAFLEKNMKS